MGWKRLAQFALLASSDSEQYAILVVRVSIDGRCDSCLHPDRPTHKARVAATFQRPTKVFEDGIQLMHLNYPLAFDGIIASRGGIPLIDKGVIIGAIGSSGGTDSQDEIVSEAGAAVINQRASDEN
jgi:uncharacterized protein GlcG (DUF336 family)